MGSLDKPAGSIARRIIRFIDVTNQNASQMQQDFNEKFSKRGWRFIQLIDLGSRRFIIAEKEE